MGRHFIVVVHESVLSQPVVQLPVLALLRIPSVFAPESDEFIQAIGPFCIGPFCVGFFTGTMHWLQETAFFELFATMVLHGVFPVLVSVVTQPICIFHVHSMLSPVFDESVHVVDPFRVVQIKMRGKITHFLQDTTVLKWLSAMWQHDVATVFTSVITQPFVFRTVGWRVLPMLDSVFDDGLEVVIPLIVIYSVQTSVKVGFCNATIFETFPTILRQCAVIVLASIIYNPMAQ